MFQAITSHNINSVKLSSHFNWWVSFKFISTPMCKEILSRNFCQVDHDSELSLSFCSTCQRYDGIIEARPWI